jgi:interferon gamma-inducible protein 30
VLCLCHLQMKHFGYIYCTEQLVLENKLEKWADCLEMVGLSRAAVDCYINGYGNQVNPEACRILNSSVETLSRSNSSVEKLSNSPQVCYSNHSQNLLLSNSFYTLRLDLQQSLHVS